MFEATIITKTLKRAIYPLFMLNDEGIFKIDSTALTCQVVNTESTEIAEAIMPAGAYAWDNFTAYGGLAAKAHTVGIDLKWMRHAAVSSLPIGIVRDARDALIRGLYDSLMEYPCDECGKDADVVCYHGRALCECCIEREQRAETRDSGKMLLDAEVV